MNYTNRAAGSLALNGRSLSLTPLFQKGACSDDSRPQNRVRQQSKSGCVWLRICGPIAIICRSLHTKSPR